MLQNDSSICRKRLMYSDGSFISNVITHCCYDRVMGTGGQGAVGWGCRGFMEKGWGKFESGWGVPGMCGGKEKTAGPMAGL
jgi:hypothetical protein